MNHLQFLQPIENIEYLFSIIIELLFACIIINADWTCEEVKIKLFSDLFGLFTINEHWVSDTKSQQQLMSYNKLQYRHLFIIQCSMKY